MEDKISQLKCKLGEQTEILEGIKEELEKEREVQEKLLSEAISIKGIDIDQEELISFFKKPYVVIPKEKNEWYILVPAFLDFHAGYFDRREGNYNIFLINIYTQWIGGIPEILKDEIKLPIPDKIIVKGNQLLFDSKLLDKVKKTYNGHLSKIDKNKAVIKRGHEYNLIADIIENGSLPFSIQPVNKEDLRIPKLNFETIGKYSFQDEAYQKFLKYGSLGVYWATGSGKSFFAMKTADSLKGMKILFTASSTLVEQWNEYVRKFAPRLMNEMEIATYQAMDKILKKYENKEVALVIFDECDRLPATTFSRGALIRTKYRIGLSATPYREDGKTNLIFALTGFPIGLEWKAIMDILGKKYHKVRIHILKNQKEKLERAYELVDLNRKTLIFCDGIALGKEVSDKLKIPHIYGQSKKRLKTLHEEKIVVISRVGDYGISIKDLEHIIEIDFLFGSRKQQLQRTGRLLHGIGKQHDILFTETEFEKYKKRLYGFIEKGFKIEFVGDHKDLQMPKKKALQNIAKSEPKPTLIDENIEDFTSNQKIDFIKSEYVRKQIDSSRESHYSDKLLKKIIVALATSELPLDYRELADILGHKNTDKVSGAVTELERLKIVNKVKKDRKTKVDINVSGLSEIKKLHKNKAKIDELTEELFNDG